MRILRQLALRDQRCDFFACQSITCLNRSAASHRGEQVLEQLIPSRRPIFGDQPINDIFEQLGRRHSFEYGRVAVNENRVAAKIRHFQSQLGEIIFRFEHTRGLFR